MTFIVHDFMYGFKDLIGENFRDGSFVCNGCVDEGKNPSQQRETLPVQQVPIILTNVWYGRLDRIKDLN